MPKGIRKGENRTITISISKSLVDEIDALAKSDNRSRSNWVVAELQKSIEFYRERFSLRAAEMPTQPYVGSPKGKNLPKSSSMGILLPILLWIKGGFFSDMPFTGFA